MPTPEQVEALNWYHRRGHPVAVCRTMEGAFAWLRSIGAPVPNIINQKAPAATAIAPGAASPVRRQHNA